MRQMIKRQTSRQIPSSRETFGWWCCESGKNPGGRNGTRRSGAGSRAVTAAAALPRSPHQSAWQLRTTHSQPLVLPLSPSGGWKLFTGLFRGVVVRGFTALLCERDPPGSWCDWARRTLFSCHRKGKQITPGYQASLTCWHGHRSLPCLSAGMSEHQWNKTCLQGAVASVWQGHSWALCWCTAVTKGCWAPEKLCWPSWLQCKAAKGGRQESKEDQDTRDLHTSISLLFFLWSLPVAPHKIFLGTGILYT